MARIALMALLLSGFAFGFSAGAHRHIAEQVFLPYFPDCKDEIDAGAVAPDAVFRDTARHHCYPEKCAVADEKYCPKKIDCPARLLAENYTQKAEFEPDNCRKAYYYAVASHYLADTHVVFHNTVGEDQSCHSEFERRIDRAVEKNPEGFEASIVCDAPKGTFVFSSADLQGAISDVRDFTGFAPKNGGGFYSPVLIVLVFLAAALLLLRNRNKK